MSLRSISHESPCTQITRRYFAITLCLFTTLFASNSALAHDLNLSGIRIDYRGNTTLVTVTTHISRLRVGEGRNHAVMSADETDKAIRRRLKLRFGGKEFLPGKAAVKLNPADDQLTWESTQPASRDCEVLARLYPEDVDSKTAVVIVADGAEVLNTLLDSAHPDMLLSQPVPKPSNVALRYLHEGVLHILGGFDHVFEVAGRARCIPSCPRGFI